MSSQQASPKTYEGNETGRACEKNLIRERFLFSPTLPPSRSPPPHFSPIFCSSQTCSFARPLSISVWKRKGNSCYTGRIVDGKRVSEIFVFLFLWRSVDGRSVHGFSKMVSRFSEIVQLKFWPVSRRSQTAYRTIKTTNLKRFVQKKT